MSYIDLPGLGIVVSGGVASVTIDNPPLNLLDAILMPSLTTFVARVRDDRDVRVIVFESADPDFFIAHGDMRFVTEPETFAALAGDNVPASSNIMQQTHEAIRSLPQVTIGKLAGLARGGGNELLMALDMRFGAIGKSGQAQPETLMGIIPGGGGTQYFTRLAGRARAIEGILGGALFDAELAERYGLINRALPADELDAFVDTLAARIARLGPDIIARAKAAIDAASVPISAHGLAVENDGLSALFTGASASVAQRLLDAGVQTRDGELDLERILNGM